MTKGYLRQDDSGHWYAVPEDKVRAFDKALDEINSMESHTDEWYDAVDVFIQTFSQYQTGGGIGHIEIILP